MAVSLSVVRNFLRRFNPELRMAPSIEIFRAGAISDVLISYDFARLRGYFDESETPRGQLNSRPKFDGSMVVRLSSGLRAWLRRDFWQNVSWTLRCIYGLQYGDAF